jgi:low affinity Fe/Cu permease
MPNIEHAFSSIARTTARAMGRPLAFISAASIVLLWAISGPAFHFSDSWQLVINTGTTIVTFLMVFLIQHSQNHDTDAVQLKLAELIRAVRGAQNSLVDLESLEDTELQLLHDRYAALAERARKRLLRGHADSDVGRLP